MSMAVGPASGDAEVMVEMNTTPLIDVMLVLLVMLIVTIPIQTHAVKLDLPQANNSTPPSDVKPVVVDLEIDFDGTVIWNGSPVPSGAQLDKYLEDTANQVRNRRCICAPTGWQNTMQWPGLLPMRSASVSPKSALSAPNNT